MHLFGGSMKQGTNIFRVESCPRFDKDIACQVFFSDLSKPYIWDLYLNLNRFSLILKLTNYVRPCAKYKICRLINKWVGMCITFMTKKKNKNRTLIAIQIFWHFYREDQKECSNIILLALYSDKNISVLYGLYIIFFLCQVWSISDTYDDRNIGMCETRRKSASSYILGFLSCSLFFENFDHLWRRSEPMTRVNGRTN